MIDYYIRRTEDVKTKNGKKWKIHRKGHQHSSEADTRIRLTECQPHVLGFEKRPHCDVIEGAHEVPVCTKCTLEQETAGGQQITTMSS